MRTRYVFSNDGRVIYWPSEAEWTEAQEGAERLCEDMKIHALPSLDETVKATWGEINGVQKEK